MADLPTIEEMEEALAAAEEYEHPEPETREGACSNLGEMPDDLYYGDADPEPDEDDDELEDGQ